jgi:hypothetical protein
LYKTHQYREKQISSPFNMFSIECFCQVNSRDAALIKPVKNPQV